jgi:hypothetical protein
MRIVVLTSMPGRLYVIFQNGSAWVNYTMLQGYLIGGGFFNALVNLHQRNAAWLPLEYSN